MTLRYAQRHTLLQQLRESFLQRNSSIGLFWDNFTKYRQILPGITQKHKYSIFCVPFPIFWKQSCNFLKIVKNFTPLNRRLSTQRCLHTFQLPGMTSEIVFFFRVIWQNPFNQMILFGPWVRLEQSRRKKIMILAKTFKQYVYNAHKIYYYSLCRYVAPV